MLLTTNQRDKFLILEGLRKLSEEMESSYRVADDKVLKEQYLKSYLEVEVLLTRIRSINDIRKPRKADKLKIQSHDNAH